MCWKEIFLYTPYSMGPVSSVRFSGNKTRSTVTTAVAKTKNIHGLFTVVHHKDLLRSIWEYLECWSPGTWVVYFGKLIHKDFGNKHPHQRHMAWEVRYRDTNICETSFVDKFDNKCHPQFVAYIFINYRPSILNMYKKKFTNITKDQNKLKIGRLNTWYI